MKTVIIAIIVTFLLTVPMGLIAIPILRKIKIGQPILKYVEAHKEKNGTPTMGGLFFILPATAVFAILGGFNGRISSVATAIGLAYLLVGFLDDLIKIKRKDNQGLKAYQKIIFQTAIAILSGIFVYRNGLTVFYIPFSLNTVDLGILAVPLVAVIFIAVTNSVNLTDGLDGLAGSVSFVYLSIVTALIILQMQRAGYVYTDKQEYLYITILNGCLIGGILGFLVFNTSKAKVFMGDTGALSLGGFIGAISIFSSNSLFIPIIGIMFVLSSISVIVQVVYYKRTKKRIFLMAPLHHHFQMKGYSEVKISFIYSCITLIAGTLSIMCYL